MPSIHKNLRKPDWLKIKLDTSTEYQQTKDIINDTMLNTVCVEARCPNIYECWNRRTATIMILGDICTRSCGFCAVKTGKPSSADLGEPSRVANAVKSMNLKHVVITSVDRDDLRMTTGLKFGLKRLKRFIRMSKVAQWRSLLQISEVIKHLL